MLANTRHKVAHSNGEYPHSSPAYRMMPNLVTQVRNGVTILAAIRLRHHSLSVIPSLQDHTELALNYQSSSCQVEEKEERDSERVVPNVIARFYETTSKASPSLQSVDLLEGEVSRGSQVLSTKRHAVYWRSSSRMSSVMQSPTASTPSERLSQPWTWCMHWRGRVVHCTASAAKCSRPLSPG